MRDGELPAGEAFLLPRFEAALRYAGGMHNWADVARLLISGHAQYWQTPDGRGALITELLPFPNLIAVNYWLAAGDLTACRSLVPEVERWAIAQGATRGIGGGRPGFARVLGPDVKVCGVQFRKELVT